MFVCVIAIAYIHIQGAQFGPLDGEIRLNADGDSRPFSGRLEIHYNYQSQSVMMDFNKLRQRGLADNLGFWAIFIMAALGIFGELASKYDKYIQCPLSLL